MAVCILVGCGTTVLEVTEIGPNLTLISDFGPAERTEIQREVSASYLIISNYLGFEATPPEPTELYVFRWPAGYKDFLRRHNPQFLGSPACIFREDERLIIAIRASSRTPARWNLRHELTHAVLASNLIDVPQWIDEGLAQYFEAGTEPGTLPPQWLDEVQRYFRDGGMPSIFKLIVSSSWGQFDRREHRASWILVHFIIQRHGVEALLSYARQTYAGQPEPMAFIRCFGVSPYAMQYDWRGYVLSLEAGRR